MSSRHRNTNLANRRHISRLRQNSRIAATRSARKGATGETGEDFGRIAFGDGRGSGFANGNGDIQKGIKYNTEILETIQSASSILSIWYDYPSFWENEIFNELMRDLRDKLSEVKEISTLLDKELTDALSAYSDAKRGAKRSLRRK